MVALSPADRSLYVSPAIALALLACGVDAGPGAVGRVEPAPTVAQRAYVIDSPGDVSTNNHSTSSGAARGAAAPDRMNRRAVPNQDEFTPTPVNRYRFDGQGTMVRDSIGGADGSLVQAELAGDGFLRLRGGDAYVELPGGLLSQHESATLEFWLAWESDPSRRNERIFDFGSNTVEAAGVRIDSNFSLSPSYEDARPRLQFRDQSGDESQLFSWRVFPERRTTHVVVVLDGVNRSMAFYMDGESLGSSPWNQTLAELRDENVWLGRSQLPADPNLSATFDEFRIYDRALSSEQIEENFANGPDGVAPSDAAVPAVGPAQVPVQ